jgi:Ca2+-transporting ATPase
MKYKGLSQKEAEKLLKEYGPNEIKRTKKISPLKIFISQFTSPIILLLIVAAIISFGIGFLPGQEPRTIDTTLILIIVFASGVAGFVQDYKAEKAVAALQKMAQPKAIVIRNGKQIQIPSSEIVPGDIIVINPGDIIPADAVILETMKLKVNEAPLTGESKAVAKKKGDEIYKNTYVYVGEAIAKVTATGMKTKIGQIANKLQEIKEEKTPFQDEMAKFSKKLVYLTIGIIIVTLAFSVLKYNVYESLLTSISLAVAAIPEGLPAVVTLSLALGASIMAKENSLVRKLSTVESIGAVDVICTDKTGTITKNEMTVVKMYTTEEMNANRIKFSRDVKELLLCGALCNDAEKTEEGKYFGDPTEIALLKIGEKYLDDEVREFERLDEVPFSSERKMMSVLVKDKKNNLVVYAKGAPEVLIKKCTKILSDGKIKTLTPKDKKRILSQNKKFASEGLRVLGFAFKPSKKKISEDNLIWIGLQAMIDPPHPEVEDALKQCKTAGIRVIMITGDNPITAQAIAKQVGLESKGVITGSELKEMSDKELEEKLNDDYNIFARVDPFHKLRILEILKKDNMVAMTGDGVNDALAIKKADVGIAMGINGTEVAKQASDMILLDDNFATIVTSVKEGRRIFDNIRSFVDYLLTSNTAEVLLVLLATVFLTLKYPILLPVQLLWINLLTDGLPALALGVEPARKDVMKEPPRKKGEPIINKQLAWLIGAIGIKKTGMIFLTFFLALPFGVDVARTTLFTGIILYEFVRIGAIKYMNKQSWLSNKWLLGALFTSLGLQLTILYTPLNKYFHIVPLGLIPWAIIIGGVIMGYILAIIITEIIMRKIKD